MTHDLLRRTLAEFFGTFWLTFGGCGAAVLAAACVLGPVLPPALALADSIGRHDFEASLVAVRPPVDAVLASIRAADPAGAGLAGP